LPFGLILSTVRQQPFTAMLSLIFSGAGVQAAPKTRRGGTAEDADHRLTLEVGAGLATHLEFRLPVTGDADKSRFRDLLAALRQ